MMRHIWWLWAVIGLSLAETARAAEALVFRGAWQQGGMVVGRVAPIAKVALAGRRVEVGREGYFVLGLGRDAPAVAVLTITDPLGQRTLKFEVAQRQYEVQRIDGVPQRTVTPPPEVLNRIQHEQALVDRARARISVRQDFLEGFARPLEGPITGVYGSARIYNGVPKNPHYGLDIAAPTGTLVYAPAAGQVSLTHPDMYFSGGTLILDHGQGLSSTFIHLSEILVQEGMEVARGEPIARVGATGRATGPHLDWRMNWRDERIDPQMVLDHFPAQRQTSPWIAIEP